MSWPCFPEKWNYGKDLNADSFLRKWGSETGSRRKLTWGSRMLRSRFLLWIPLGNSRWQCWTDLRAVPPRRHKSWGFLLPTPFHHWPKANPRVMNSVLALCPAKAPGWWIPGVGRRKPLEALEQRVPRRDEWLLPASHTSSDKVTLWN